MSDLSIRVRQYLDKRKPIPEVRVAAKVSVEEDNDDLAQAWADFKYAWRIPYIIFKVLSFILAALIVMWALAVVSIQNDCYLDKRCREWVTSQ